MSRRPSLDQWTDIALRRVLKALEQVRDKYILQYDGPPIESLRGELRDLLKARRERMTRNRKLGLCND